jgi:hypothetical protein
MQQPINKNKQQTAVDWLRIEINKRGPKENNPPEWLQELYAQAKELEKQQIINAFDGFPLIARNSQNGEEYYNETYNN